MLKLLFLDTETTGNDPKNDRLCQICYKIDDEMVCEYFKPPLPISVKSMSITHITNKHVADKSDFKGSQISKQLQDLLQDYVLVAHNAIFDIAMLEAEGIKVPRYICTLKLARYLDAEAEYEEYNLQFLRYLLELDVEGGSHDAQTDVLVLEALFNYLYLKIQQLYPDENEALTKMIEISTQPTMMKKFNFGKYRGKTVAEVSQFDREYLLWLLNQKITNTPDDIDWIYTLEHHTANKNVKTI